MWASGAFRRSDPCGRTVCDLRHPGALGGSGGRETRCARGHPAPRASTTVDEEVVTPSNICMRPAQLWTARGSVAQLCGSPSARGNRLSGVSASTAETHTHSHTHPPTRGVRATVQLYVGPVLGADGANRIPGRPIPWAPEDLVPRPRCARVAAPPRTDSWSRATQHHPTADLAGPSLQTLG